MFSGGGRPSTNYAEATKKIDKTTQGACMNYHTTCVIVRRSQVWIVSSPLWDSITEETTLFNHLKHVQTGQTYTAMPSKTNRDPIKHEPPTSCKVGELKVVGAGKLYNYIEMSTHRFKRKHEPMLSRHIHEYAWKKRFGCTKSDTRSKWNKDRNEGRYGDAKRR